MLGQRQRSTATCSRHAGPVTFGSYPFGLEQLDFSNCSTVCAWRFLMTWSPFCFWRIEAPHRRRQPWYYGYSRRPCRTLIGFYWVMSGPEGSAEKASPRIVRPRLKATEACLPSAARNTFLCETHVMLQGLVIGFFLLVLVFFITTFGGQMSDGTNLSSPHSFIFAAMSTSTSSRGLFKTFSNAPWSLDSIPEAMT